MPPTASLTVDTRQHPCVARLTPDREGFGHLQFGLAAGGVQLECEQVGLGRDEDRRYGRGVKCGGADAVAQGDGLADRHDPSPAGLDVRHIVRLGNAIEPNPINTACVPAASLCIAGPDRSLPPHLASLVDHVRILRRMLRSTMTRNLS